MGNEVTKLAARSWVLEALSRVLAPTIRQALVLRRILRLLLSHDRVEMDLFYLKSFVLLFENVTLLGNSGNGKLSICHQQRKLVTECEAEELKRSSVTCLTKIEGG